jgi:PAS domain S-box-containing protein
VLIIADNKPITDLTQLEQILKIFAARTASELERVNAELKIIAQERDQSEILNSVTDAIFTVSDSGKILSYNQATTQLFGYTDDEIKNITIGKLSKDLEQNLKTYSSQELSGKKRTLFIVDASAIKQDGHVFPVRLSISEISSSDSGNRRFTLSLTDMTEVNLQGQMIRRTQKMDALGKLTGGIAHDYNNMLGIITGYTELLEAALSGDDKLKRYTSQITHAANRGAKLSQKLLAFSRNKSTELVELNINDILREEQDMLAKTLTARVSLVYELDDSVAKVKLDPNDFEDAILNLCINAMHALNGTGQLIIKTKNAYIGTLKSSRLAVEPGDYVVVDIIDSGCGMTEQIKERIFEPFFSTKGDKGTGLGLAQVYGFMKRTGGVIDVTSKVDEGSTFSLYFPVAETSVTAKKKEKIATTDLTGSNEHIFVLDDEVSLTELCENILTSHGYRVTACNDPEQALQMLRDKSAHYDLVMTDVVMPNIDGYEIAQFVTNELPDTKILLTSGYTEEKEKIDDNHQYLLLNKPYKLDQLLSTIKQVLN